jgi:hypothetical protein
MATQDFYIDSDFAPEVSSIVKATLGSEDDTTSGTFDNFASIRLGLTSAQTLFNFWTNASDMNNTSYEDILYRIHYTSDSGYNATAANAVPLSPDYVVGAIVTATNPEMNPDGLLTYYLPQDNLRSIAKNCFNTTRGVDLFSNEQDVLESINTQCRLALHERLVDINDTAYDSADKVVTDPSDPVDNSSLTAAPLNNPSKKIYKQLAKNVPERLADITSYAFNSTDATTNNWYKMPLIVGDNIYISVSIASPDEQKNVTNPNANDNYDARIYQIKCTIVADGDIPSPYTIGYDSALGSAGLDYPVV